MFVDMYCIAGIFWGLKFADFSIKNFCDLIFEVMH